MSRRSSCNIPTSSAGSRTSQAIAEAAHAAGAQLVAARYPMPLGLLKPPGELGADIVVAEGQSLGVAQGFGGPYVGLLGSRKSYLRQMPGRLAGITTDSQGKRGFVLTLQTREQHIRREKATSNICTNQGLMATAATVYMSSLGPQGFREVANRSYQNAHYLADRACQAARLPDRDRRRVLPRVRGRDAGTGSPRSTERLQDAGIIGGLDLSRVRSSTGRIAGSSARRS